MRLPIYTNVLGVVRYVYGLGDLKFGFRVPMIPALITMAGWFVTYVIVRTIRPPMGWDWGFLYFLPAPALGWLYGQQEFQGRPVHRWLWAQIRYATEPRCLTRLQAMAEPLTLHLKVEAWQRKGAGRRRLPELEEQW